VLARLRSDAVHHAGGGRRRSGAVMPPPDVAHVLRLQRTIGNRATTRLLRQPVAQPHALKTAGITTDSKIDRNTPKWIQAAFDESQVLRPYLRGKFPGSSVTDGKFKIYDDEKSFNEAAKRKENDSRQLTPTELATEYGDWGGFYDRQTHMVHVRSRTKFGNALHEAMHRVAHPAFDGFWDKFVNEGVTQYFTDCLLKEQGLPEVTNHKYQAELACAKQLIADTSWEMVASAYFLNDQRLREAVERRLKLNTDTLRKDLRANKVCARL
jgi:hypothetical protein